MFAAATPSRSATRVGPQSATEAEPGRVRGNVRREQIELAGRTPWPAERRGPRETRSRQPVWDDARCRRRNPLPKAGWWRHRTSGSEAARKHPTRPTAIPNVTGRTSASPVATIRDCFLAHSTAISPPIRPPPIDSPQWESLFFQSLAKPARFFSATDKSRLPTSRPKRPQRQAGRGSNRRRQRGRDAADGSSRSLSRRPAFQNGVRMEREASESKINRKHRSSKAYVWCTAQLTRPREAIGRPLSE